MGRGRLAVVVGLLASGVAWGNPTPGSVWGYVIWPNGQPMQAAQVYALPASGTPGETDDDGRYEITGVSPGNYEVYINTEYCCHEPQSLHRPVTVVAGQATRLDFTPQPLVAMPEMEIDERKGQVVGNLTAIRLRLKWEACTVWPRRLRVAVDQRPAGRHGIVLCDAELDPDWVAAHTVGFAWDERDVLWAFGEVVVPWDTTLCANAEYDIAAKVLFDNSFCGNQPDILVDDSDWATVRNVVIHGGETSADSQDYLVFDPAAPADSDLRHPSVTFQIVDEGPAFSYRWTVYVRKTDSTNWCADYVWLTGTAGAGQEVTAVFNVPDDDQTQSADLDEWGSYAFDVQVVERMWREELQEWEDIDEYWLKYPYYLRVPQYEPGTTEPSHEAVFMANPEQTGSWNLWLNYYLHDNCNESAQWVNATILDPELEVVEVISDLPTAPGVMHSGLLLKTFSESELLPGIYRVILTAEDSHGDDHYSPANLDNPKRYREGENKRMLAANDETESPVHGDLGWDALPEDKEELPGGALLWNCDDDDDSAPNYVVDYADADMDRDDDELRPLRIVKAARGSVLKVTAGASRVALWTSQDKAARITIPGTGLPVTTGTTVWVEGVQISEQPADVVFQLLTSKGALEDTVKLTVVGVTNVAFEALPADGEFPANEALSPNESVTVHYGVPTPPDEVNYPTHPGSSALGLRIFPDKQYGESAAVAVRRRQVQVVVTLGPAPTAESLPLPQFTVYLSLLDLDDTSAGAAEGHTDCTLDTNDSAGPPRVCRGNDNTDSSASLAQASIALPEAGQTEPTVKTTLQVGLDAGDNYRVLASVIQDKLTKTGVSTADGIALDFAGPAVAKPNTTEPLTVWRRLWVEVDSMGARWPYDMRREPVDSDPPSGGETIIYFSPGVVVSGDFPEHFFQGGSLQVPGAGAYSIADSYHDSFWGTDVARVQGSLAFADVAGKLLELSDDDQYPLPLDRWPSAVASAFSPAFVQACRLDATDLDAPYDENVEEAQVQYVAEGRRSACRSDQQFWVGLVHYGNDGPVGPGDNDPSNEGVYTCGSAVWCGANVALVYCETGREFALWSSLLRTPPIAMTADGKVDASFTHEVGHLFGEPDLGVDTTVGGIMNKPAMPGRPFVEGTVSKIRRGEGVESDG